MYISNLFVECSILQSILLWCLNLYGVQRIKHLHTANTIRLDRKFTENILEATLQLAGVVKNCIHNYSLLSSLLCFGLLVNWYCCQDCCKVSQTPILNTRASFSSMKLTNKTLNLIWQAILNAMTTCYSLIKLCKTVLQESGSESGISCVCKNIWVNKLESLEVSIENLL